MIFAKRKIWVDGKRCVCEFEEDGTVTFADDVSPEELQWTIGVLLREAELQRQLRIGLKGDEVILATQEIGLINTYEARRYHYKK
jgi:sorbitol-specific phosphotransferase system component IIA